MYFKSVTSQNINHRLFGIDGWPWAIYKVATLIEDQTGKLTFEYTSYSRHGHGLNLKSNISIVLGQSKTRNYVNRFETHT